MDESGRRNTENAGGRPRRRSPLLVLLLAGVAAFVVALALGVVRTETPAPSAHSAATATANATATATGTATAVATATAIASQTARLPRPCENVSYQTGDVPIVPPRKAGEHLQVALDAVRPGQNGNNRWIVRFFVPSGAPGPAEIPLRASLTGPQGPLLTGAYEAGPPNAGPSSVTQPVTLQPCVTSATPPSLGTVVVGVETAPVRSGTYTLTWSDIRLPEGGTRTETWTLTLTCQFDPGPAQPPATFCR